MINSDAVSCTKIILVFFVKFLFTSAYKSEIRTAEIEVVVVMMVVVSVCAICESC